MKTSSLPGLLLLLVSGLVTITPLHASDPPPPVISDTANAGPFGGGRFVEQDGPGIYRAICQGCHMSEGQGAKGAGMYPALANNPRLAASGYLVYNVVHGRRGMPGFGQFLSDAQIAAVTNYVRSNMGNQYADVVSAADVARLR